MKSIKFSFGYTLYGLAATAVLLATSYAQAGDMTNGVVKRVDTANGKLTIKHEEIVNLDMPGMTMVFDLKDKTAAGRFVPGDAVKFSVELEGNTMVITQIEASK
ncbi:copper-binding protein [Betaproteobacteria bacterium LSUCC0117]|nr:copper-binding protein [Betaproteobacteria bacterium LSUCC0117]